MNNRWNAFIYKCWAPIYDFFFNQGAFYRARKRVFDGMEILKGSNVLFVGIGTGADLEFFPLEHIHAIGIDYSPDMLKKAKERYSSVEFKQMDAQHLLFPNQSFDIVVASLILSVVPDPHQAMAEMVRVTKRRGRIVIFDKFSDSKRSVLKRTTRPFLQLMGTDIGRSFKQLYETCQHECRIVEDEPVMLKGMYRKIIMEKR
ncbi:SAM-dependent methyltransferase [Anoxybacillus flavithermus]|uniref:SAM-dependent methyltransferase n=1 Tax=Anoxybacillus flavithermus TaxID=33934 RepID=A0A2G5RMV6_9BACL|nr:MULTISPECIES: methyltransferase domain-containing protein [Anoxybacillus]KFZ41670.1 phosphatidylethanolamine N-methyltransferase [Anoxybacillus sp. KU2-6(11)]PIC03991.1 SAM-dependent methyltransferase [Anoxybacillus flavithermus]